MRSCIILTGALFAAACVLSAQTGTVRVRVIDAKGAAVADAEVSLADSWDRTLRTLRTNRAGEVVWSKLRFGQWYFSTGLSRQPLAICDSHERTITLQVAPLPSGIDKIVIYQPGPLVDIQPMPICDALDLPKPSPHK